jgi:hypothetical protein
MQVLDCPCGVTLQAANAQELATRLLLHLQEEHSEPSPDAAEATRIVAERSYPASDS